MVPVVAPAVTTTPGHHAARRGDGQREGPGRDTSRDRRRGAPRGREDLLALDLVVGVAVRRRGADEAVAVEIGIGDGEERPAVELGAGQRVAGHERRLSVGDDARKTDCRAAARRRPAGDDRGRRGRFRRAGAGIGPPA